MLSEEKSPLMSDFIKGRCWCCWETHETTANPLIRACLGCKDVDLQWIHQECIDQYIYLLPQNSADEETSFYCTRCKDPYQFERLGANPLKVLISDQQLLFPMILVTISMIMITVGSIDTLISYSYDRFSCGLPVWIFSLAILIISHVCNVLIWIQVVRYCSKKGKKRIIARKVGFRCDVNLLNSIA